MWLSMLAFFYEREIMGLEGVAACHRDGGFVDRASKNSDF